MANVVRFTLSTARNLYVHGAGPFTAGVLDVDANNLHLVNRTRYLVKPYGAVEVGIVDAATPPPTLPAVPASPNPDPYPQYVTDAELAVLSTAAPDATSSNKGLIQLAGDLAGTAATPTVPGLADKVSSATYTTGLASAIQRVNHTGTQPSSTIVDLTEAVQDIVGAFIVNGVGSTAAYNDVANTLAINVTGGGGITIADLPAGSTLYADQNDPAGTWPNRPTSRTDVKVIWLKTVVGSSDPAAATSPAVNGAYAKDVVVGV